MFSAGVSSPSENRLVASTTSGGSRLRAATCCPAVAAFFASPVMRYSPSSADQLAGSAGLMFTPRNRASIARGASRRAT